MMPSRDYHNLSIVGYPMDLARGDIINAQVGYKGNTYGVSKRIIGLPGEYVEVINSKVYINGALLEESYIESGTTQNQTTLDEIMRRSELTGDVIPNDYYLLLGDNREKSQDSRIFGLVHKSEIISKEYMHILDLPKTKKGKFEEKTKVYFRGISSFIK